MGAPSSSFCPSVSGCDLEVFRRSSRVRRDESRDLRLPALQLHSRVYPFYLAVVSLARSVSTGLRSASSGCVPRPGLLRASVPRVRLASVGTRWLQVSPLPGHADLGRTTMSSRHHSGSFRTTRAASIMPDGSSPRRRSTRAGQSQRLQADRTRFASSAHRSEQIQRDARLDLNRRVGRVVRPSELPVPLGTSPLGMGRSRLTSASPRGSRPLDLAPRGSA